MDRALREGILEANRALHAEEAGLYDRIHPELTNREERERLERMLAVAVKALPGDAPPEALDVGAGTGFVTARLVAWGFRVDAVDLSAAMLGRLEEKLEDEVRLGRVRPALEDADTFLATHDRRYAVIAASSVLHHLPDYPTTLRALADRLVPGGSLLLFHEPAGGAPGASERFLRRLDWKLARLFVIPFDDLRALRRANLDYAMADYHETHGFDEAKVREALKDAGLAVVARERYTAAQTAPVRAVFRVLFPPRSWALVARKAR